MSLPTVVAVDPGSAAARAGLTPGDEILSIAGQAPRDIIEYRLLVDEPDPELEIRRGGLAFSLVVAKEAGEALGAEVHSAVFDRVQTCDNHCEFCFIYQLPPGMRRSLYLKDDDYRLSFLYGNFTTLTRFTEADLERVVSEGLSPLFVSIHATDPAVRARMLRNRRGAMSLRWLRALLDAGIEVHGQIVVCPGVNDGAVLDDTLCGVLDRFPELASVAAVPLGVSRYSTEPGLRSHTRAEAAAVVAAIASWQETFTAALGRRMIFAADEYYLLAGQPFPPASSYDGFPQHENGIGMAAALQAELAAPGAGADATDGDAGGTSGTAVTGVRHGFFAAVDGAPADGYRAPRAPGTVTLLPRRAAPVGILTGEYGAEVLGPLLSGFGRSDVRLVPVRNDFFGGNIAVTGLLVGSDLARTLADEPEGHRYLLPDVCLSRGLFLDGTSPADLPRPVEIIPTTGDALRAALGDAA
ncbi:MAG: TIGR03279 family radical SAM protein [Acidimicrobiales bacterium]